MRCPKCEREGLSPGTPCRHCGFSGPPGQLEELGHIAYLLGELETWPDPLPKHRDPLRDRYLRRREELETDLGLHRPPPTPEEAQTLRWQQTCLLELKHEVAYWQDQGWLQAPAADALQAQARAQTAELRRRLAGVPVSSFAPLDSPLHKLELVRYLRQVLEQVRQRGELTGPDAYDAILAELQADKDRIKAEAGLAPRPAAPERAATAAAAAPAAAAPPPARPPRPPRVPLTRERLWQTLLSERTLNVILFLGAFLLIASATTYVIANWDTLPSWAQLLFIVLFTLSFYGGGWFLRVRMGLRASGIALTAVGSLLVPLDFYAVLLAGGVWPPERWPWVWLIASAVCLPVYFWTALRLRAQFFGYLVVVAAGSLLCAALRVLGVPSEWWLAALVALALVLAVVAYRHRTHLLSNPFRFSALLATAVILPLGIGWWLALGIDSLDFDLSLAVSWALGAILFGYAALQERSPLLGRVAATAGPVAVLLLLRLVFKPLQVEAPWYALALGCLGCAYLLAGHRLLAASQAGSEAAAVPQPTRSAEAAEEEAGTETAPTPPPESGDPILRAHSQTAVGWGLALMAAAGGWAVFDLWAAAATHAVLAAGVALAVRAWQRPRAVPVVSLLALSATTFGMAAGHLEPAELGLGWALLALLHMLAATLPAGLRAAPRYAAPLFAAVFPLAGLAVLAPLAFAHEPLLTYALGHWIGLAAWWLWLDRSREHPGLDAVLSRFGRLRPSIVHWAVAAPLPFFAALLYTRWRAPDAWLGLLLAALAWACFAAAQLPRLLRRAPAETEGDLVPGGRALPWSVVAYACSLAGPGVALRYFDQPLLAVTILSAAALYFASAWTSRRGEWWLPGGLALPLGLVLLFEHWHMGRAEQGVVLAGVAAAYLLGGLWLERARGLPAQFVRSLPAVGHVVAAGALGWSLVPAFEAGPWPDSARLWAAAAAAVLAVAYALLAWFEGHEHWAHVAVWLSVLAGGLVALAYSQGRGSSAFKVALLAVVYVLGERGLAALAKRGRPAWAGRAWPLFRRPLLIAGWAVSAGAIGLALVRNLWLLGGGRSREAWAIAGLLTITALYAASAWLFRRRLFLWLAGGLFFVPWTLLTAWGWFVRPYPAALSHYAPAWALLALLELAAGLALTPSLRTRQMAKGEYGLPPRVWANVFMPLSLLWGVADTATSVLTWGLGLVFYVASAVADHRRGLTGWRAGRFLYPAVATVPAWAVYLLHQALPHAPYELYGLLLLALSLPLLGIGRVLHRRRADVAEAALPLYVGTYALAAVGTLLVASQRPLAVLALTFDLLLCLLSVRLFREPLWAYPAAALAPAALLLALAESAVAPERRGWPVIALGAGYLLIAWLLRRVKQPGLAVPPLVATFAVVALGLPPSSQDDVGAFWGYLAAALVYAAAAAWLRQPLLVWPALGLLAVPYGVAVANLPLARADYGLALFPGVAAALLLAHALDARLGQRRPSFPSWAPSSWRLSPLLDWWAAPAYAGAYLGALVAVGLSWGDPGRLAIALGLAALAFLHATWRFRRREALLVALVLGQAAALAALDAAGWLRSPGWAALGFVPVTVATAALGLAVGWRRREGSPLGSAWWQGWSRPFYLLLAVDLLAGQWTALLHAEPGAAVTLVHAGLLAVLATAWIDPFLPFAAAILGVVGLGQALDWAGAASTSYTVAWALLSLGYGLAGYGLRALAGRLGREAPAGRRAATWLRPLEWTGLGLSGLVFIGTALLNLGIVRLVVRTFLGNPPSFALYAAQLRMVMWVLALTGLLYLATAVVRRWRLLGYGAVALLLGAWALWWRFFVDMPEFQWYAVPAGLYLLGIGWLEWRSGSRTLARWVDRAAMLLWLGSAWYQSLPGVADSPWRYALIMGAEALFLVWYGSARRRKEFLYAGLVAVVLDAITQSIEPLLTVNRWIVFGIAGLLLVGLAVLIERRLDRIRALSAELRSRLETWE